MTSRRCAENDLIQWCSWLFYTWATEARERRQRSISEHLERQVSGARVVQSQMTQGWQRAVAALGRQQMIGLQRQLQDALRSWSFRSAWKKRYQRRLCSLLCCAHRARDLRRYMWRWQVMLLQEKSANRVERSRRHVDSFISRLHSAWLLQQVPTKSSSASFLTRRPTWPELRRPPRWPRRRPWRRSRGTNKSPYGFFPVLRGRSQRFYDLNQVPRSLHRVVPPLVSRWRKRLRVTSEPQWCRCRRTFSVTMPKGYRSFRHEVLGKNHAPLR